MKPKLYQLLERCISDGIDKGIYQYNKHEDQPIDIPEEMKHHLVLSIMNETSEWFSFTDEDLGITN